MFPLLVSCFTDLEQFHPFRLTCIDLDVNVRQAMFVLQQPSIMAATGYVRQSFMTSFGSLNLFICQQIYNAFNQCYTSNCCFFPRIYFYFHVHSSYTSCNAQDLTSLTWWPTLTNLHVPDTNNVW